MIQKIIKFHLKKHRKLMKNPSQIRLGGFKMTKIGLKRWLGIAKGRPRDTKVGPRGSKRCPR